MELLLIRHSITQWNKEKRYLGSVDMPIIPEGEALALERREGLPTIDKLWVSPMVRCRQTAKIMFPGMEQNLVEDLRECNFGAFEGKTWEELESRPDYRAWIDGAEGAGCPDGEKQKDFTDRCCQGLLQVLTQAKEEGIRRVGILAHGGTLMVIMKVFGQPERESHFWMSQNCRGFLTRVEEDPLKLTLIREI